MLRQIAGRVTGTAFSTVRFAAGIPLGVARSVLGHVLPHGSDSDEAPRDDSAGRESAQQQAAATPAATSDPVAHATPTPAEARTKGTPKSGKAEPDQDTEPEVVLSIDAPPEVIEPPIDVVGEALANEAAEAAAGPQDPQPVHVNEETEVVYSTSTDED